MRDKIIRQLAVYSCGLLVVAPAVVRADEKARDFYFQQNQQRFVHQAQDARMFGMAGSSAMTQASSVSMVNNPAGLGRMQRYGDMSATYSRNTVSGDNFPGGGSVEDTQNMGQVYGATPLGPRLDAPPEYGNLGLGWYGRSADWGGDPTNTSTDTYQVSGGYGALIGDKAAMGYSLTYQNDAVDLTGHEYNSSASFLHNVGVQYFDQEDLVWGAAVTLGHGKHDLNHLQDIRNSQSVNQLSVGVGGGFEYDMLENTTLGGVVDYTYYSNSGNNDVVVNDVVWGGDSAAHAMNIKLGVENRPLDWLALRAGWRYAANFDWDYKRKALDDLSGGAKYNAFAAGAGVDYKLEDGYFIEAIKLDYGVEYRLVGTNDWQHVVTLTTPFDLCV